MRRLVTLGLVGLFVSACAESKGAASAPAGGAPVSQASASIAAGGTISGKLLEQMAVGPYVYVRLETPSGEVWAAVNEAPLTIGEPVTVYNVMRMERFESPTLQRTFDQIYFGSLEPGAGSAPGTDAGMGAADASMGAPPAEDANVGAIARANGTDARTIGELWTEKSHLAGATVSVRGVVVKYNGGVMGKNWIHLQDGSGDAARGTHDVAVTSLDEAAVGDTITVTGTVRTNLDVGAGYTYALLVEDAKLARK